MKLTINKLLLLSFFSSCWLYATNGANLIAMGAKSRGMGGVGIAMPHGAESGLANGALITTMEGTEVAFGGTLFLPIITANLSLKAPVPPSQMPTQQFIQSSSDTNMIPEVSLATKIKDHWYLGFGVWGVAGMGTDYVAGKRTDPQPHNFGMRTNLQLLQLGMPMAYTNHGFSFSFTPMIMYGNLKIDYDDTPLEQGGTVFDRPEIPLSQDVAAGFGFGFSYDFRQFKLDGLRIGANYRSSFLLTYKDQISNAIRPFNQFGLDIADDLEQPEEFGIGVSYTRSGHSVAFDLKKTLWSKAKGYGDFGWEDGTIYAGGYQYKTEKWAVRVGYNYSKSVVVNLEGATLSQTALSPEKAKASAKQASLNVFNILGFPATAEEHYTAGASYKVSKSFSVDIAGVYQVESTVTVDSGALNNVGVRAPLEAKTTHQETSGTVQLVYNF